MNKRKILKITLIGLPILVVLVILGNMIFWSLAMGKAEAQSYNYSIEEIDYPEQYKLIEKKIGDDCTAFQMIFHQGEYIFVYSLSGSCTELTDNSYTQEYKIFLEKYKNILIEKGYIVLNYEHFDKKQEMKNEIVSITKRQLKRNTILYEEDENSIVLKVDNILIH